jgi:SPX domain protein involved in polyphosphate accumulation
MATNDIRKFNRFELKYLLDYDFAQEVMKRITDYMVPDSHGNNQGVYFLSSLYYDTDDFRFFWEKIEGEKFRRKLRVRIYEDNKTLNSKSKAFVEIKQRLNKVTQKRRIIVPYGDALKFCNDYESIKVDPEDQPVAEEMLDMLVKGQLKPQCITSYQRQAFNGTEKDPGLRVTFDTNLRYRRNNLDLADKQIGPFMLPPNRCIMEVKVNDRIPYWLTEFAADANFQLVRISKYCTGLQQAEAVPQIEHIFQ